MHLSLERLTRPPEESLMGGFATGTPPADVGYRPPLKLSRPCWPARRHGGSRLARVAGVRTRPTNEVTSIEELAEAPPERGKDQDVVIGNKRGGDPGRRKPLSGSGPISVRARPSLIEEDEAASKEVRPHGQGPHRTTTDTSGFDGKSLQRAQAGEGWYSLSQAKGLKVTSERIEYHDYETMSLMFCAHAWTIMHQEVMSTRCGRGPPAPCPSAHLPKPWAPLE